MPGLELAITQLSNRFASVETAVATIGANVREDVQTLHKKIDDQAATGCEFGKVKAVELDAATKAIGKLQTAPAASVAQNPRTAMWNALGKAGPVALTVVSCVAVIAGTVAFVYLRTRT